MELRLVHMHRVIFFHTIWPFIHKWAAFKSLKPELAENPSAVKIFRKLCFFTEYVYTRKTRVFGLSHVSLSDSISMHFIGFISGGIIRSNSASLSVNKHGSTQHCAIVVAEPFEPFKAFSLSFWPMCPYTLRSYHHLLVWQALDVARLPGYAVGCGQAYFRGLFINWW